MGDNCIFVCSVRGPARSVLWPHRYTMSCYYRYTEHSTVGLAQQWDQLDHQVMRMQHNIEQQIQAKNQSGVSEDALREFSMMFK